MPYTSFAIRPLNCAFTFYGHRKGAVFILVKYLFGLYSFTMPDGFLEGLRKILAWFLSSPCSSLLLGDFSLCAFAGRQLGICFIIHTNMAFLWSSYTFPRFCFGWFKAACRINLAVLERFLYSICTHSTVAI